MRKAFYGSLCYEGIRGGEITVDDEAIIYRSKVLTLPEEYKNIKIPFGEVERVEKWLVLLFPAVTVWLKLGKSYKFVVFGRKRFLESCKQKGVEEVF